MDRGSSLMTDLKRWPTELRLAKDKRSLRVAFDDGTTFELPGRISAGESPSAEVQGHSPAERKTVPGKRNVEIIGVRAGRQLRREARLRRHASTGIYGWDYLHELGAGQTSAGRTISPSLPRRGCRGSRRGASRRRPTALSFRQGASPAPGRSRARSSRLPTLRAGGRLMRRTCGCAIPDAAGREGDHDVGEAC